jgi:hypothetical protein
LLDPEVLGLKEGHDANIRMEMGYK